MLIIAFNLLFHHKFSHSLFFLLPSLHKPLYPSLFFSPSLSWLMRFSRYCSYCCISFSMMYFSFIFKIHSVSLVIFVILVLWTFKSRSISYFPSFFLYFKVSNEYNLFSLSLLPLALTWLSPVLFSPLSLSLSRIPTFLPTHDSTCLPLLPLLWSVLTS